MLMDNNADSKKLNEIREGINDLETRHAGILSDIGEKALPYIAEKPEFAELVSAAGKAAQQIGLLKQQEAELLAEKERREKEEKERLARLTCFSCKTVNPEGAKFCEECGARLGAMPREYCQACSTMNQPGMKFCGECGAKLGEAAV